MKLSENNKDCVIYQLLSENNSLTPEYTKLYNQETALNLLFKMLYIQELDNRAIILQKTGLMHTYPSAHGHEAIAVAIGETIKNTDVFVPYYRDHGTLLSRGATALDILNYWSGKCAMPKTGANDMPMAIPIATQCSHAAGIAYAIKLQQLPHIVICSLGDGATSKGDFYEALNFAVIHKLPLIFLISNNQWAISTPLNKQSATNNLADKAKGFNCPAFRIDGTDIFALTNGLKQIVASCRNKQQPVLIEAITYRLGNHTTVDNAKRYMPKQELEQALKNSPINRLIQYLRINNFISKSQEEDITNKIFAEIDDAATASINQPVAKPETIFDHMYKTLPNCLISQKKQLLKAIYNE